MEQQYANSACFAREEPLDLGNGVHVVAARLNSDKFGHVRLDLLCSGVDVETVIQAIVSAKTPLCPRIFAVRLPAEDIFENVSEHDNCLFKVSLG